MDQNNRNLVRHRISLLIAILVFGSFTASAQTNDVFNLADFEPASDGITDDGPALQRALDAVAAAGGGTLQVPAGLYLIKTPVIVDFAGANVVIQGVPSNTMPAPPTAAGDQLSLSLDLASEFIPATGMTDSAITLRNINNLTVEHLAFTGIETVMSDAFITLFMSDVKHATVRHCEFYGIATFGAVPGLGGGNIIRAVRSELSVESSIFLGCAANSGAYAPIIENIEWKRFSIANSVFIDYGQRSYFGKMGLGAPVSWINLAGVAPRTADSPRREAVIRDTFLDEGGWIGITAFPHMWGFPVDPIDLVYISGLKMNVSNLGTAGHQFFNVRNVLIENSHYGWSKNTRAAIDLNRTSHAILDRLTCIEKADRIRTDEQTERLTVINSVYGGLDSNAQTTTEMQTAPEDDPVQYVRQRFLSVLNRQPDPAAHFYWSDVLIRCGSNNECLNQQREALGEYLANDPQQNFSISGNVEDENGAPISGATVTLSGSQSGVGQTDALGNFRITNLPTSGTYTVTVSKRHYSFTTASQNFVRPPKDLNSVNFSATLNRHTISGRLAKPDNNSWSGVTVNLVQSQQISSAVTDKDGVFSFPDLAAGQNYTIAPVAKDLLVFTPLQTVISDLSADTKVSFLGRLRPEILTTQNTDAAVVLDSVSYLAQPFSIFEPMDFADDGMARVLIFAKNLEVVNNPSQVIVTAEDPNHLVYPLPVEFVGDVSGQSWLKQLNIKLLPSIGQRCFKLRVFVDDLQSNPAQVCFAPAKTGS
ncbi:MAG TPA: carboxypeptidase regulatory-like domain-containing protein [Pyrinomonadaceae bacterium]|nr:carboxypeptidase regulatory-like domain-containing protein [Pyrinomonadaceae bacterium]